MLLERIYDENLAQASYFVGCQATGDAVVIDPNRDVEQYLRFAEDNDFRITHVTETHIHADFVSGARELAARTGAQLHLSDEGGPDWRYAFAAEAGAKLLKDGDRFLVGNLRFDVLHTPGHTPEHISFLVTDTPATDKPLGAFTGDFIFVGDVGRPDLLEKAAKMANTMDISARMLFRSIQQFKQLPDYLQIWPGHGAGSACGKALGAVPQSTLGYERIANWALQVEDEDRFVELVLEGQPEPPKYFAEMKRINRDGPPILGGFRTPARLTVSDLEQRLQRGELVVDTRSAAEYARGYIPGTISIPLNRSFDTYGGWLLPYDREFTLIADPARIVEAVRDLAFIGLDSIAGYFDAAVVREWKAGTLGTIPQISAPELARKLDANEVNVLDVRGRSEWDEGHIPGVPNIPMGYVADRLDEIPRDRPLVVQCLSGSRSAIAASVLLANGFRDVINLSGGFAEWERAGQPVERAEPELAEAG